MVHHTQSEATPHFVQAVFYTSAVFAAYGWKSDLSDEEILEKLLALNLERGK